MPRTITNPANNAPLNSAVMRNELQLLENEISAVGSPPLTTKGDLYTFNTTYSRLAVGTNGQILSVDLSEATGLKWINPNAGNGTVTSVSVVTANGISGSVATETTTPAITLTLGAITPTSVNSLTLASQTNGFTIAGGTTSKTLTVPLDASVSGTNTGDETESTIKTKLGITTLSGSNTGDQDLNAYAPIASPTFTGTVAGITAEMVGLGTTSTPQFAQLGLGKAKATGVVLAMKTLNASTVWGFKMENDNTVNVPFGFYVTGDAQMRFDATATGILEWGDGTNALDTNLYRSAANVLKTDDAFIAGAGINSTRVTPRIVTATSYTTDTGSSLNADTTDMFVVTAQAGDLLFNNPSGTHTDGQKLIITVASSTTTARALTWGNAFGATTVALPTTTTATTATLSIGFIWSTSKSLWQCVAVA